MFLVLITLWENPHSKRESMKLLKTLVDRVRDGTGLGLKVAILAKHNLQIP